MLGQSCDTIYGPRYRTKHIIIIIRMPDGYSEVVSLWCYLTCHLPRELPPLRENILTNSQTRKHARPKAAIIFGTGFCRTCIVLPAREIKQDFNKIATKGETTRWQVHKEAVDSSRVLILFYFYMQEEMTIQIDDQLTTIDYTGQCLTQVWCWDIRGSRIGLTIF